ncbi:hypothetical protein BGZ54_007412 [Gamsiella multidivaricata]|nr:hypothetical protein BGZ54_007412 [Gamsiella multidivaricata]
MGSAWLCALLVNYSEHKYTIRSSNSLFIFYLISIFGAVLVTHTHFRLDSSTQIELYLSIAFLIFLIFGFVVEAWPRGSTGVQQASDAQAFDKANLFSQLTFHFFQPIISLAAKKQMLQPSDIASQLPESYSAEVGYTRLSARWNERIQGYYEKLRAAERGPNAEEEIRKIKKPSLLATILITHWKALVPVVIIRIAIPFTEYLAPALLGLLLDYVQGPDENMEEPSALPLSRSNEEKPLLYGVAVVIAIFVVRSIVPMLYSYVIRDMYLISCEIKSSVVAMIYRKALKLSPDARRKSSTGSIINHMSVDAALWEEGVDELSIWASLPFDFGICLFMLYRLLGWSFLAGLFTILALVPLQIWRAGAIERLEEDRLKATDERVRMTSEVLSSSKVVKLYGWESTFRRRILGSRAKELDVLRRMGILEAIMSVVFASSSIIVGLLTFTVYVTIGNGVLTPKIVFVSLSLMDLLHEPVSRMAEGTSSTIALIVGNKRIQRFLLREEIDDTQVIREECSSNSTENVVEIRDATLSWTSGKQLEEDPEEDEESEQDEHGQGTPDRQRLLSEQYDVANRNNGQPPRPVLQKISLAVREKTITAIVGRVGQGKSSLLSAIIGEMYKLEGSISIRGRIAYVPQQAWILNATLRDNILFGNDFDPIQYQQVLYACGLEPDLVILPAGDLTEIGERGINLSGGQKQRVSLARAAYGGADVYLLDDPLSAVDAHVDRHLWDNLIGPHGILKDKTRILVTHGIHHLEHVDQIIVMKDGEIAELGKYEDLMSAQRSFYQLIKEYSTKQARKRRGNHAVPSAEAAGESHTDAQQPSSIKAIIDDISSENSVEDISGGSMVGSDSATVEDDNSQDLKRITSKDQTGKTDDLDQEEDELIAEEIMKKGGIEWKLIKSYARACTVRLAVVIILINIVTQICTVGVSLWLKHWISKTKEELQASLALFLGGYAAMTVLYVVGYVVFVHLALAVARIRASELIHRRLLTTIIRLPMSFFDTTPIGRIVNRFSSDMFSIDEHLPWKFMDLIYLVISVVVTTTILVLTTPVFAFMIPVIVVVYYLIQQYFLWAARSLKRIRSVSISPLYQHFDETLNGVSTIRAMGVQQQFIEENAKRIDYNANAFTAYQSCDRWVELRLQILGAGIIFVVALSGVFTRYTVDPSLLGLSLSFALDVIDSIMWLCRDYSSWQSHVIAIERVQEYTDKCTEAPEETDTVVSERWPDQGRIVFKDYSTRYREGLNLVIKHLTFEVFPGEKIGIVGRTGAGKSSLTFALFRIIEAANSYWARASDNTGYHSQRTQEGGFETDPLLGRSVTGHHHRPDEEIDGGSIEIDGINISTLGLTELRKHLAIIPQDPTLFAGTVRDNLDPFREVPDSDLWEALERAHLKDYICSLSGGLSAEVAQNGENFSVGQRSLICLARALLRKSKILILDEATAAVDVETDELIQRTICQEFKDRTVLTIAHRIKTVMDSSRILVMEQGEVAEFDAPGNLLQNPESLFFKLAHQAGEVTM